MTIKRAKKEAARPGAKPEMPSEPVPFRPVPGARLSVAKPDAATSAFAEIADRKKRAYLEGLAMTPSFGEAARLAGISARTGWNYRSEASGRFSELLEVALQMGLRRAEDEGWRRGVEGWEEPVYQGGKLVGTKLVKSDTMLIFMLKAGKPEKYRERHEISGPGGKAIQIEDLSGLSDKELAAKAAALSIMLKKKAAK